MSGTPREREKEELRRRMKRVKDLQWKARVVVCICASIHQLKTFLQAPPQHSFFILTAKLICRAFKYRSRGNISVLRGQRHKDMSSVLVVLSQELGVIRLRSLVTADATKQWDTLTQTHVKGLNEPN